MPKALFVRGFLLFSLQLLRSLANREKCSAIDFKQNLLGAWEANLEQYEASSVYNNSHEPNRTMESKLPFIARANSSPEVQLHNATQTYIADRSQNEEQHVMGSQSQPVVITEHVPGPNVSKCQSEKDNTWTTEHTHNDSNVLHMSSELTRDGGHIALNNGQQQVTDPEPGSGSGSGFGSEAEPEVTRKLSMVETGLRFGIEHSTVCILIFTLLLFVVYVFWLTSAKVMGFAGFFSPEPSTENRLLFSWAGVVLLAVSSFFIWCGIVSAFYHSLNFDQIGLIFTQWTMGFGFANGVAMFTFTHTMLGCLRYVNEAFYLAFGFTPSEIAAVQGPRGERSCEVVETLSSKYGERYIKSIDALTSRSCHIMVHLFVSSFFVPFAIPAQNQRIVAVCTYYAICFTTKVRLANSNHWIACTAFGGCRISDGRYGRIYLVVSEVFEGTCFALFLMLAAMSEVSPDHLPYVISFGLQPMVWGDAMGDLIGNLFGRIEFSVHGIKELNSKTLEGTVACLAMSVSTGWCYMQCMDFPTTPFGYTPLNLVALVALVATLANMFSTKGAETGMMMVTVVLALTSIYNGKASNVIALLDGKNPAFVKL